MSMFLFVCFFFSSRRRHTSCALVTGVQTCALPISSARVKPGDVVELGAKAREMALVMEAQSLAERDVPEYVAQDGPAKVTFVRVPTLDEVPYPVKKIGRASCRERVCQYV